MFQPHFYSLKSRLGLRFKPHGSDEVNIGVEDGPDAVLGKLFPSTSHHSFSFSSPESVRAEEYYAVIAQESHQAAELILTTLNTNETPVMIGGDHSIAFTSLLAVQKLYPVNDTAVVMFDSHADLHLMKTSPSGNFHGMWLRPFFETFDQKDIARLVPSSFQPSQLRYVGNLVVEEAEVEFLKAHNISVTTGEQLSEEKNRAVAAEDFKKWILAHQHLHVSFDIDMFRADLVPATGTTNKNGLTPEQVWPLLEVVASHPSVSIDVVEVNPRKSGALQTIELAQKALQTLLGLQ